jgi:hypothetical protein
MTVMAIVEDSGYAPNWYPDPTRRHRLRYFDGTAWTDHVADEDAAAHDPLGDLPAGLLQWPDPGAMVDSGKPVAAVDTPRLKMWVFAVLSLALLRIRVDGQAVVVPVGVIFAALCWRATNAPLVEQWRAGNDVDVTQMWTARRVAAVLAFISVVVAILAAP